MNDKEVQTQLEALQKELTEAKKQMAATIAYHDVQPIYRTKARLLSKKLKWKIAIFAIILLAVIGGMLALQRSDKATIQTGSFIEQIKDLSSLATSQAYVKAVIEKEDNQLFGKEIQTNLPGTKRKFLLIIPGTVTAGVDLSEVKESNLQVDTENKTIEIHLPRATILQDPALNFDEAQVFSVEGIFRDEVNWSEAYELAEEAKGIVKEEAMSQGLMEVAEANAEKTLKEFFEALGYSVEITYDS